MTRQPQRSTPLYSSAASDVYKRQDVAIAVTKKDNSYQGHTCLTLDMAYNNARLIAKPESTWLSI